MNQIIQLLLLALLGSVIALLGGIVFLFSKRLADTLEEHSVPFAAGVLLTVSLLGLLPEAVDMAGEGVFLYVLLSFVGAYLFEHFLLSIHHHHSSSHIKKHSAQVSLVILGDTIHNFIDGVAIATSFLVSPGLGLVTAVSTFLHEVPHEISDFGILLKSGWARKDVLIVNILSASFTMVGAFTVFFFLDNSQIIGILLAVSAGLFLYLGASDFLPEIETGGKKPFLAIAPFIIGILVMVLTLSLVPHEHEEQDLTHEGNSVELQEEAL